MMNASFTSNVFGRRFTVIITVIYEITGVIPGVLCLNLTLNLCFSMFIIRKHQHIHTHCPCHKSLRIISICHGTAPAKTVLSYVQVQYIYLLLGSSKHIYPPLRFSLDYAMTLHDMIALHMSMYSAQNNFCNDVSCVC